jgi:hypothetical protein
VSVVDGNTQPQKWQMACVRCAKRRNGGVAKTCQDDTPITTGRWKPLPTKKNI